MVSLANLLVSPFIYLNKCGLLLAAAYVDINDNHFSIIPPLGIDGKTLTHPVIVAPLVSMLLIFLS